MQPELEKLGKERDILLTNLQDHRRLITTKRENKAKELSEKLDNKIRLKVHARSNKSSFRSNHRQEWAEVPVLGKVNTIPFQKSAIPCRS